MNQNKNAAPKAALQQLQTQQVDDLPERAFEWLKTRITNAKNIQLVSFDRASSAAGMSSDMFIIAMRWQDAKGNQEQQTKFVIRAELNAPNNVTSNSNYMAAALKRLGGHEGLPIPRVLWTEHDESILGGSFCVMEFLEGVVAPDNPPFTTQGWFYDGTKAQREKMYLSGIEFLTKLHKVDWQALGLDFLLRKQKGFTQTQWHLNQAIEIYDGAVDGQRGQLEQGAIEYLQNNLPGDENLSIAWCDSRPGNMLWKDFELVAALDWEMITLLDPAYDVALWILTDSMYTECAGIKRLPGMLERAEFVDAYQRIGDTELTNLEYFEVLTAFRSHAVVCNMVAIWERQGQSLFTDGSSVETNPLAKAFQATIARIVE